MDSKYSLPTDLHHSPTSPDASFSTTLAPILASGQVSDNACTYLPPPSSFSRTSMDSAFKSQLPSVATETESNPLVTQHPIQRPTANPSIKRSDMEGTIPEYKSTLKPPSDVETSVSSTDKFCRLALGSRENVGSLGAKEHESPPGPADNARSILISTW
ncbi:hypothetical protein K493DRAFT_313479 [Basidiobolus meristosporus CBS 931.73]|uniref:Uncharacterized protein n=1 Tax=Basidiobolus meristosporus CBS 931.73 TaxID=1314790 RepID=A0A1Y1YLH9_9FUNG|nr:hypothetical protein K493DRAFT_313479 [Basidiobolus meristosporus CBS 931.73]|eukprot:ORX98852.1 hypothetical protein K493DRAFT_313479 [Basidiobolus meristosporus CBS 931.73]